MFKGSITALVTPFSNGEVDNVALKNLVNWQISEGSKGLVPVGTTGESPTLTHTEHEMVVEQVVKESANRVPIIAGAGSNSTAETIRFIQHAESVGATAGLVVTPYYNKPTQAGLIEHFSQAHNSANIPIIIYNIPGRSAVDMWPDTMGILSKLPRIIGVKDATGDLSRVPQQRLTCGENFIQLSGEDATALGFNAHGGTGCISVTSNVAPRLCSEFQEATLNGDFSLALEITDKLMPLHQAIFTEPGLCGVKYGLSLLGFCSTEVRSPLTQLHDDTKIKIKNAMKFAGIL